MEEARQHIAVIGSGIAGLGAAHYLSRRHRVELFESDRRLGGHAHTHLWQEGGRSLPLDSGFIVYNHRTYPHFVRLLDELGVAGQPSDMSFGVRCRRCSLEYSSRGLPGLFAQPRRLLDRSHIGMLLEIPRFNRRARAFLRSSGGSTSTLGDFLAGGRYYGSFVRHFLLPMGGAIWSAPFGAIRDFPARSFLTFFRNHGWLTLFGAPRWWTVKGGSRSYVEAIARGLGSVHLATPVQGVRRLPQGVELRLDGGVRRFDAVVVANHADQALRLLEDPSPEESRLLGSFRYSRNRTVLHRDVSVLPRARGAWASWNCEIEDCADEQAAVSVSYHLNRLQRLTGETQICVSLNRPRSVVDALAEMDYTHPILDAPAIEAQEAIARINGQRSTYFAGAHLRYGFHEDGLWSAIRVAEMLGVRP
jgi:predicted NAD/FAD-binding protein